MKPGDRIRVLGTAGGWHYGVLLEGVRSTPTNAELQVRLDGSGAPAWYKGTMVFPEVAPKKSVHRPR